MANHKFVKLIIINLGIVLLGCQTENTIQNNLSNNVQEPFDESINVVTTKAEIKPFLISVNTNGKILSKNEIQISFKMQGVIKNIYVSNGQYVKKGQLIASLENSRQILALKQAELLLDESKIELNDQLIVQGGRYGDSTSVKENVYSFLKIRSGFAKAQLEVYKAKSELQNTTLYAPESGIIANLSVGPYNSIPFDKPLCIIVNNKELIIKCHILETELNFVQINQPCSITPIGQNNKQFLGKLTEINPIVNEQGLIEVTIKINNPSGNMFTGMNAHVTIDKIIPQRLVIPKIAVLDRNEKKMVFVYENGKAKWHYVTIGIENDKYVSINSGIKPGMDVITSGHVNLGHDSMVKLKKQSL